MDTILAPETAFPILHVPVFAAWLLLILAPGWHWTRRMVHEAWIPLGLSVIYSAMLVWGLAFGGAPEGSGFTTLRGVMTLFTSPAAMLNGWIHYLAFDLFVGAWIARDAMRRSLPHFLVAPCQLLTLLYGPLGFLGYFALRWHKVAATLSMQETPGDRP